jgi:hypothetical protein
VRIVVNRVIQGPRGGRITIGTVIEDRESKVYVSCGGSLLKGEEMYRVVVFEGEEHVFEYDGQ